MVPFIWGHSFRKICRVATIHFFKRIFREFSNFEIVLTVCTTNVAFQLLNSRGHFYLGKVTNKLLFLIQILWLIAGDQRNQQRIENVERCFGAAGTPLQQEGRILIGEGVLNKCSKRGQFIKRHFFLFNDILVYGTILINKKRSVRCWAYDTTGKGPKSFAHITSILIFPLNRYNQQRIIPLEGISIEKIEDYEGTTQINGWTIRVIIDQELKSKFLYA